MSTARISLNIEITSFGPVIEVAMFVRIVLFVLGLMAATVSSAQAQTEGFGHDHSLEHLSPIAEPQKVGVGIQIDQVTFVDQQSENFGVVGTLFLKVDYPEFAFDPETYGSEYKSYSLDAFRALLQDQGVLAPYFILRNQQGRRFTQQTSVLVKSTGRITYAERFTATLQAPHFNFRRYPFDTQEFYIEVSSLLPSEFVEFYPLEEETGMGDLLGEEEWILRNPSSAASIVPGIAQRDTSMVALRFEGTRHVQYYILRIILPLVIILFVTWATFFLEEYRRRIDMASANLLVFVAFNFAISTMLPKLGYLTFMDSLLVGMFVITGSTVLVNILLRRMKTTGREALARKIDTYLVIWVYPILHAVFLFWAVKFFLL
ncbi:hypothetical protein J7382_06050 [Shimia sp. R11_0]|uniref:hypothetical protein n=1 Tax=Shimia sp. R11_0 TaxID=2821096 RepID=UPI001ADBCFCE|nr:hypothetical protein [Shimia sp. R11_0]MBO9477090.1 hypothetical protein [Shimia sp. R11_0]